MKQSLLGFRSLKDVDKVIELLKNQKIEIAYYTHLQSDATKSKIDIVNSSIDKVLEKASILQGKNQYSKKSILKK